jgi:hypothetical protein
MHSQPPGPPPAPSSELLKNSGGQNDGFGSIGRFQGALTCTGTLIDPSGAGSPDARAWLLTAGHCISLEPYGVIRNQPSTAPVQFNYFIDTPEKRFTVRSRAVGWSTMKGVDVALVELDATLGDLTAKGIHPFHISTASPDPGRAVFWTGIPQSPIPPELQFLRLGRCTLGTRVQLIEGSWIWNNELSNNCPDLYEGASGSPLFDTESGEILGVIGTSTLLNFEVGPDYDCQRNRPCVSRAGGPVMQQDTSYASPVQGIGQCFDQSNALDVLRPGCPLDPGLQLTVNAGQNEVQPEVDGKPATWAAALSGIQHYYSYKHFRMGEGDCASADGFSTPLSVTSAPLISDPVGSSDDYYFLCVIAGDTPSIDSSWQQPSHASIRFKRIDSQPPIITVDYKVEPLLNSYRLNNVTNADATSDLGIAVVKSGPPASTDCSDTKDYRIMLSIPQTIRTSDMPIRVCWKMSDKAGNYALPIVFEFGAPAMLPNAVKNAASLERGTVAAGSSFQVDTFNLTSTTEFSETPAEILAGVRVSVVDASGRTLPAGLMTAGPLFLQGVIPPAAIPGSATVSVQPPQGPSLSLSPSAFVQPRLAFTTIYDRRALSGMLPMLTAKCFRCTIASITAVAPSRTCRFHPRRAAST